MTGVTGNSATILLINDTSSTVIGQLGTNQMTGSIIGQLGGVLIMENIDSAERLQIGDTVTTAGIDLGGGVRSPFPKGILVGSVVDVLRDANAVTQTAFIQPAADLERLEYVLVITDYQGGLPPVDQQPIPCASGRDPARGRAAVRRPPRRSRERSAGRGPALLRYRPMKGIVLAGGTATRLYPADDRHQQAPPADLRPADDLLPDRDAGRDGHPRGDGHRRRQERRRRRRAARRRLARSGST